MAISTADFNAQLPELKEGVSNFGTALGDYTEAFSNFVNAGNTLFETGGFSGKGALTAKSVMEENNKKVEKFIALMNNGKAAGDKAIDRYTDADESAINQAESMATEVGTTANGTAVAWSN